MVECDGEASDGATRNGNGTCYDTDGVIACTDGVSNEGNVERRGRTDQNSVDDMIDAAMSDVAVHTPVKVRGTVTLLKELRNIECYQYT